MHLNNRKFRALKTMHLKACPFPLMALNAKEIKN